ncbi:MAG: iron ABC transporter permease, partial [Synergistaceae bacterium]|nr:iron ABC transporter permease [Synergistaceae bacterium]
MNGLKRNDVIWTFSIAAAIIAASAAAVTMGRYDISFTELGAVFLPGLFPDVEVTQTMRDVIFNIRIPRVLLALLAGAGLAAAGGAFQAIFSNPLATPDTLGVATGASFGAVFGILFGMPSIMVQISALVFGLAAVCLVYCVSRSRGSSSIIMMILAGMVVGALFSALVSLVKFMADPQDVLPAITFWLMGSLSSATKNTLAVGSPMIIAGIAVIYALRWKLNAMSLSEEEAASLGISVKKMRVMIVAAAAMITASIVSMCGLIGWVGL